MRRVVALWLAVALGLFVGAGAVVAATCSSQCGSCSGDTCSVAQDGTVTCQWDTECGPNCTEHHTQVIRCPDGDFGPKDSILPKLPG